SYEQSESSGKSVLSEVQVYGRDATLDSSGTVVGGSALPPITFNTRAGIRFDWDTSAESIPWSPEPHTSYPPGSFRIRKGEEWQQVWEGNHWFTGDVNGDGHDDLIVASTLARVSQVGVAVSRNDGTFSLDQLAAPYEDLDGWIEVGSYNRFWFPGDFNGDGKTDVIGAASRDGKVVALVGT